MKTKNVNTRFQRRIGAEISVNSVSFLINLIASNTKLIKT